MKRENGKHCIFTNISKLPTSVLPVKQMFLKGYHAALTYQGELSSNHAMPTTAVHSAGELSYQVIWSSGSHCSIVSASLFIKQQRIYLKWEETSNDIKFWWLKLQDQQWLDALEMTRYYHGLYKVDSDDLLNLWFGNCDFETLSCVSWYTWSVQKVRAVCL
jgi:hypothetical protein